MVYPGTANPPRAYVQEPHPLPNVPAPSLPMVRLQRKQPDRTERQGYTFLNHARDPRGIPMRLLQRMSLIANKVLQLREDAGAEAARYTSDYLVVNEHITQSLEAEKWTFAVPSICLSTEDEIH